MPGGLYRIWLSPTHYYIGRTADFRGRWQRHLCRLRQGVHENAYMQNVFNQYQEFRAEVLLEIDSDVDRQQQEQQMLDGCYGQPGCVNVSRSARGVMQGRKHSEATKAKFRARRFSDATKQMWSENRKGHPVSEETRQKCSAALRGKKRPDNAQRNAEQAGWHHTEEAREKIAEANRQREHPACTPETREKISQSLRGRKQDPEVVARRAVALQQSWDRRKQEQV